MMVVPFAAMHLIAIFGAWHVGFRWEWLAVAIGFFYLRMFGITAGYHRYFSHRSFETSRWFAFVLAFLGSSAAQKGVIWWAGHHRDHHKYSDQTEDIHSPVQKGFWQSHVGWILGAEYDGVKWHNMKDFAQYPEIRFIQNYWLITPVSWGVLFFYIGGWPLLVWGLFVSTVALYHATFTINSLSHVFGKRRYKTTDTSRNNWMLALLTMGEGWHNNHHYYQASVRQGFYWWEIDMSYMILKVLSWFGIVWNLKVPPERVLNQNRYTADELAAWRQDSVLTAPAIPAPVEAN
ncbi:MAG: acyl-CoA desaturase [Deltaproteobacteria bacterium]|nr:acyl-CoA desaturase [Deltaproteobacteria bacterium]